MTKLNHILDALKLQLSKYASQYVGNFDMNRGDVFQFAVTQPQYCMQIAIGIRLALKVLPLSADVRVSAAIGKAQFRQQEVKIGTGEAFVLDKSHENIATILNKNRSNISRILNASNYKLVAEYLSYMEEEIASWQQSCDAEK